MKDNRYIEIKKENNEIVNHLTGEYQRIANIYIKKARGYAVKNIDTEMKINDTLKVLEEYDYKKVSFYSVFENESDFIDLNIQKLSKQVKDPDRIKTIIGVSLIVLFIVAWFVISFKMKQTPVAPSVDNIKYELVTDTKIKITWDAQNIATNGYYVWLEDSNGDIQGKYNVMEETYTFTIDKNKTYTFYVQIKKTDYFAASIPTELIYEGNSQN